MKNMNELNHFLLELQQQFETSDSEKLTVDTNLSTLETFDSLTRYSIIALVNDEYKVEIQAKQFLTLSTPKKIYDYILEQKKDNE
jgi:acyl carrier protein